MLYSAYMASEAYSQRQPGAGVRTIILEPDVSAEPIIVGFTGSNGGDDFEQLPVEEGGEAGTNEIVTGRSTSNISLSGNFSAERNDVLQSRLTFLGTGNGRSYLVLRVTGEGRIGSGADSLADFTVIEAYEGVKFSSYRSSVGARGFITFDLQGMCIRRYTGEEWNRKAGTL